MYLNIIVSILLATSAFAGPLSKLESRALGPYKITSMGTYNVEPASSEIIHMDMYVHDTNPADDTTRHCRSEGLPAELKTGFTPCYFYNGTLDSSFAWTLEKYNSLSDFTLQFSHSYMDKSLGPCSQNPDGTPVFCGTKTWARADITPVEMKCGTTKPIPDGFVQTQCNMQCPYLEASVFQAIA